MRPFEFDLELLKDDLGHTTHDQKANKTQIEAKLLVSFKGETRAVAVPSERMTKISV